MATTWVSICNMALIRCGAKKVISSLAEEPNGTLCAEVYEAARDEVIEENKQGWRDTKVRVTIAVDATAPEGNEYAYRYLLPASPWCLKILKIENEPDYVIEGRYILTNQATELDVLYSARITDPTNITAHLAKAIAARIAEKVLYRLVQDKLLRDRIVLAAKEDILAARQADAMSNSSPSSDEQGGYLWDVR